MKLLTLSATFFCLLLSTTAVLAEQMFAIIALKHRHSDEIVKTVKPFLDKDGVITGKDYKLIVRTSSDNLKVIKTLVKNLDTKLRNLMITVSQERQQGGQKYSGKISGSASSGDIRVTTGNSKPLNDGLRARVHSTNSRDEQFATQRVQTIEGRAAFIQVGKLVPQGSRRIIDGRRGATVAEEVTLQPVTTGFYVTPRIRGEQLLLDVSQNAESLNRHGGGQINVQSSQTQLTGKLGEWIEIGGADRTQSGTSSGIVYSTAERSQENRSIFIMVEEIK